MNIDTLSSIKKIEEAGQQLHVALTLMNECKKKVEHLAFLFEHSHVCMNGICCTTIRMLSCHEDKYIARIILSNVSDTEVKLELVDCRNAAKTFATLSVAEMTKKLVSIQKQELKKNDKVL